MLDVVEEKLEPLSRSLVLYIEDDLSNQSLVEKIFRFRPELELVLAGDGATGLKVAAEALPALVLLDGHLPDMSGGEVLRQLRDDPLTAHLRIVILSGDSGGEHVERLMELGADGYMTKPFEISDFMTLLDGVSSQTRQSA